RRTRDESAGSLHGGGYLVPCNSRRLLGAPDVGCPRTGIPVIAVHENFNLMKNDLSTLPWAPGQFHQVDNYWEVVGVIAAMRAGIDPASVRRPFAKTFVSKFATSCSEPESAALRAASR